MNLPLAPGHSPRAVARIFEELQASFNRGIEQLADLFGISGAPINAPINATVATADPTYSPTDTDDDTDDDDDDTDNDDDDDTDTDTRAKYVYARKNRFAAMVRHNKKAYYLGLSESPDRAAVAVDIALLRLRGCNTQLNFNFGWYEPFFQDINTLDMDVLVSELRKELTVNKPAPSSLLRGVNRRPGDKWQVTIWDSVSEPTDNDSTNKKRKQEIYLGRYETEVEAAMVYDRASIQRRGIGAITNFHLSTYYNELTDAQVKEAIQQRILTEYDIAFEDFRRDLCAHCNTVDGGHGIVTVAANEVEHAHHAVVQSIEATSVGVMEASELELHAFIPRDAMGLSNGEQQGGGYHGVIPILTHIQTPPTGQ